MESVGAEEPPRLFLTLGFARTEWDSGVRRKSVGPCEWSAGKEEPVCAREWAARPGAAAGRVRPPTVRLGRAVPTVSFPPSASRSSPSTPSGCSLSLQRPDTEMGFLTPSPPARESRRPHLAGWRGGEGGGEEREITPFGIRGRRRPGGWGEPAARLCGCGGPKTPALPRDRDAV